MLGSRHPTPKHSIHRTEPAIHQYQCCVTRVGTWTRVHFTRTRTLVQFFFLTLTLTRTRTIDSEIVTRDSGPSHARVQAVAAVPCCAVYSDIRYILLLLVIYWNKWLVLADSDSDSDFEVMTRTRTRIWQPGLGHSTEFNTTCKCFLSL